MFDINDIPYNSENKQYTCKCQCASPQDAETLYASNLHISRMLSVTGEMFPDGSTVYIRAGKSEDVIKIAKYINSRLKH